MPDAWPDCVARSATEPRKLRNAPGGTRTPDRGIRNPVLYPAELPALVAPNDAPVAIRTRNTGFGGQWFIQLAYGGLWVRV